MTDDVTGRSAQPAGIAGWMARFRRSRHTVFVAPEAATAPPPINVAASAAPRPAPAVVVLDGVFHLQITPDVCLPMQQHGVPLRHLGAGWRFHSLYPAFAPVLLFELEDESGNRATWFFDSVPQFIGNAVDTLPEPFRDILLRKASVVLGDLLAPVLGHPAPGHDDENIRRFFDVSEIARRQIGVACCAMLLPTADIVLLADMPETMALRPRGASGPLAHIARVHLAAALDADFQARLITGLESDGLTWPSPSDGSPQPCSGSLALSDFDFAYRFEEASSGLVFLALVTQHLAIFCGLYFPTENIVVVRDGAARAVVVERFAHVSAALLDYVVRYGGDLARYLRGGRKPLGAFMREQHIGHQLWNELSGLDRIVRSIEPRRVPEVLVLGGRANAFFGPLDEIFPELAGKIGPDLVSMEEVIAYTYRRGLVLARITTNFVSKDLRQRIVRRVALTPAGRQVTAAAGARVILIGLRVENRTVIDLAGFLCRLVAHIAEVAPGSQIVLDGQNAREGEDQKALGSFADFLSARSLLEVEHDLCREVIASAAGKPVTVSSTTGQSVAASLAWAGAASCFIAIWGAGLAKYRWIANKPGLILSSNYHLLNPAEMAIYHSPLNMEGPAPLSYADAACVQDDPAAPQVVPVSGPRHVNFRVDEAAFMPQVSALLARYGSVV